MRKSTSAFVLVLALIISLPTEILACYACKSSPSGWSLCKSGAIKGYADCSETTHPFTGWKECVGSGVCDQGGTRVGDGDGDYDDPLSYADNSPCSWTDTETIRLV